MIIFKHNDYSTADAEVELSGADLKKTLQKTRQALENAYAGFNNATDFDLIDSYIYEINSLQQKYRHLTNIAREEGIGDIRLNKHTSVISRITRIFR